MFGGPPAFPSPSGAVGAVHGGAKKKSKKKKKHRDAGGDADKVPKLKIKVREMIKKETVFQSLRDVHATGLHAYLQHENCLP